MKISENNGFEQRISHSSQMFDDCFGGVTALKQEEYAIRNPWKDRTFVHQTDSWTDTVKKIALIVATFGGALVVATVHDYFYIPSDKELKQHQDSFQNKFQKKKADAIEQTVKDVLRAPIQFNGTRIEDMAWGAMGREQWKSIETSLGSIFGYDEIERSVLMGALQSGKTYEEGVNCLWEALGPFSKKSDDFVTLKQAIGSQVKVVVKTTILPGIFKQLEIKYGKRRALQILDMYSQSLPNEIVVRTNLKLSKGGSEMGMRGISVGEKGDKTMNLDMRLDRLTLEMTQTLTSMDSEVAGEKVGEMSSKIVVDLSSQKVAGLETRTVNLATDLSEEKRRVLINGLEGSVKVTV